MSRTTRNHSLQYRNNYFLNLGQVLTINAGQYLTRVTIDYLHQEFGLRNICLCLNRILNGVLQKYHSGRFTQRRVSQLMEQVNLSLFFLLLTIATTTISQIDLIFSVLIRVLLQFLVSSVWSLVFYLLILSFIVLFHHSAHSCIFLSFLVDGIFFVSLYYIILYTQTFWVFYSLPLNLKFFSIRHLI